MKSLLHETLAQGYKHFKLKVGGSVEDDRRRLRIARDVIGYDKGNVLMIDANQDCPHSLSTKKSKLTVSRSGPFQKQFTTWTSSQNSSLGGYPPAFAQINV